MDPGELRVPLLAKVDCSVEQVLVRGGRPKIQMVPLRPRAEAAVVVFREIGRKRAAPTVGTMMNWTISVDLLTPSGSRNESQEFEDLLHGYDGTHSLKIDARHRIGPEHEKRQPVLFYVIQNTNRVGLG